jgi:hypothetical protein
MERDHFFGQKIIEDARKFNYRCIIVDGSMNEEDLYKLVKSHFKLG